MSAPLSLQSAWWIPLAGLLLCILLLPLFAPEFWRRRENGILAGWGLAFLLPLVAARGSSGARWCLDTLVHVYVPFMILVWALCAVCESIRIGGTLGGGRPGPNVLLLAAGAALAPVIGAVGATVLLVGPFLRANAWRRRRAHQAVFFLFLVANAGGALTAIANPALYQGYLSGMPFLWPLGLWPAVLFACAFLLGAFWLMDSRAHARETGEGAGPAAGTPGRGFTLAGRRNLAFLAGIVAAVLMSGFVGMGTVTLGGVEIRLQDVTRDLVLLHMGLLATRFRPRGGDGFRLPLRRIALTYGALIATAMPLAALLREQAPGSARAAFWAAGAAAALAGNVAAFPSWPAGAEPGRALAAAAGITLLGAASYIGNAPNLIVRAAAEASGIRLPELPGFAARYSIPLLLPVAAAVAFIWL